MNVLKRHQKAILPRQLGKELAEGWGPGTWPAPPPQSLRVIPGHRAVPSQRQSHHSRKSSHYP